MGRLRGLGRNAALFGFGALVAVAAVLASAPARALPIAEAPVYAIDHYPFQKAPALKQWRSVLAREAHLTEAANPDDCKDGVPRLACAAKEAALLEEKLQDKTPTEQVAGVYAYFNAVKYKEHDPEDCGVDCWKSRLQFLAQREGDCGDHALAEYFTLRRLGFKERDLQLIVAQLPGFEDSFKGGHVVLRVRAEGEYFILDNRRTELAGLSGLREYKVLAGMNSESVQIYNLVTDMPPPGFVADAGKLAQLVVSPGAEDQPATMLVAERRKPDESAQAKFETASAPAQPTQAAAATATEDSAAAMCMQSARLGDWNPFLPCTPVNTVKMVVKAKTIIGANPTTPAPKPVEIASLTAPPSAVPAQAGPKPAAATAGSAQEDGACIQGARLADWNPDLPCTSSASASNIIIQTKDDTPEM